MEYNAEGGIKTLEEWEAGREANGFSKAWLARIIAPIYHWMERSWDKAYLWLDRISGGDEAERRAERRQEEEEEMEVIAEGSGGSRC